MSTVTDQLSRARTTLVDAELEEHPHQRFLLAHQCAGQAAVVVLLVLRAARSAGAGSGERAPRPGADWQGRNIWTLVAQLAPELAEWSGFFLALQGKRDVLAAGARNLVTTREADDLVRDAGLFCDQVQSWASRASAGRTPVGQVGR